MTELSNLRGLAQVRAVENRADRSFVFSHIDISPCSGHKVCSILVHLGHYGNLEWPLFLADVSCVYATGPCAEQRLEQKNSG